MGLERSWEFRAEGSGFKVDAAMGSESRVLGSRFIWLG